MRVKPIIVAAMMVLAGAASTVASAEVQISMQNGRVTVVARDATIRQILTEWARVGQTTIVNLERLSGGPITLQLTDVPEEEALDIILRTVSGYMAAPRAVPITSASHYDRILILPTPVNARPAVAAQLPPPPRVVDAIGRPDPTQPPPNDDSDDDGPAPAVAMPPRGPIFTTFQQPQVPTPAPNGEAPPPSPYPNATAPTAGPVTVGAPRPGMVIPAPTQPGQAPGQVQPQQRSPDD